MLSKKMAFSLTSLITILALVFVVSPAMAGEFDVTLDTTGDVSSAGELQLVHPGASLKVTVEFAQAVAAVKGFATTYDKKGNVLGFPAVTSAPATVSKKKMLTIPVTMNTYKVNLRIAKGIASADPINADKSKELNKDIFLVSSDQAAGPTVISMARVDNPVLPVTGATVQVIVTLSEQAKEFKKGNLSISDNATIADPVALDPVPEDPNRYRDLANAIGRSSTEDVPVLRGIYNGFDRAGTANSELTGINAALDDTNTPKALQDAIDAYNAVAETNVLKDNLFATAEPEAYTVGIHPPVKTATVTVSGGVATVTPSVIRAGDSNNTDWHPIDDAKAIADQIALDDVGPLMRNVNPTRPTAADGAAALQLYKQLKNVYDVYKAEVVLQAAYWAAVRAEEAADDNKLAAYFAVELGTLVPNATGRDDMLHPYVVTITPKYPAGKADIVLKIGAWEDTTLPISNKYVAPKTDAAFVEGVSKITLKVGKETLVALAAGTRLDLPHSEGAKIPASGFYLLTKNKDGSGIKYSHEKDDENLAHKQSPAQLLFNVRAAGIPNLENFLGNGGTLDLVAYDGTAATAAYISEVMWGSDASQADSTNSQWIEIANTTTSAIAVGEKKWALWAYQQNETPPASYTGGTLIDRLSTIRADWSLAGKGQGGRTNVDPGGADVVAIAPTQPLVSMVRVTDAAGAPADGTLPTSWVASTGPSVNFKLGIEGTRVATPGAADVVRPTAPVTPTPAPTVPAAAAADVMITEIMVDTGNGRSPQWIELTYSGMATATLNGWEMVIDNAIDADVLGGGNAITVSLGGVTVDVSKHAGNTGKGHSVLVTAWPATRKSANISDARVINLATQLNQVSRYQLLSYNGFRITLVPPRTGATISSFGDIAGNLHEEWAIPMSEGAARSSIIRREMVASAATMGTDAAGWILADSTSLTTGQPSFYGNDEDAGTPGHDSGGPLPVELSHFRPARDKATGAAVITWSTQSELNNAGFFIKRSQQRNGEFKVINATMVPGAGTTSEKQFYTFTDTTAQPNVVYYYQIEDVSLDGNRQTLTRGIRLKGHIGAAGKATTTWGDLKTSNE